MNKLLDVLIAEDSEDDTKLLLRELKRGGYEVSFERVETSEGLQQALAHKSWDIILCDFSFPHFSGQEALRIVKESGLDLPFIYVSGKIGEDVAVEAMKSGAHDYVMKNNLTRLAPAVERELRDAKERVQHRQAEEAMRVSEYKHRHLFENMSDAAFLIEKQKRRIIDTNRQAEALLGRSRTEILGMKEELLFPSWQKQNGHSFLAQSLSEKRGCEATIVRKDGMTVPVHISTSRVELYDREFFLALFRDISERKHAEESLTLFRTLLDRTTDAIEVIDPETGRFLDVNERACQAHGYSREEFLSLSVPDIEAKLDLTTPDLWKQHAEEVRRHGFKIIEGEHRRKDGTTFPVEINANYVHLDRAYQVSVVRDITERKRAEAEREQLTRDRLLILESIMEGIYGIDRKGCCTFMNCSAAKMLGYPIEEVLGKPMHGLIHSRRPNGSPYPLAQSPIHHTLSDGVPCRVDSEYFWRKDATAFPVEYSSSPIIENGDIKGAVIAFSDLTEKKQLEARFFRAQRLESIGQLAGGIAHDLNNILAPIMMCAPLLREEIHSESGLAMLNTVESCVRHGSSIVKQVLTFAKGTEGQHTLLQPRLVIGEIAEFIRETFPKSIILTTDLPEDCWSISGDATQLHQVLLNLAVNARDAMSHGGTLRLQVENVFVDETEARMMPGSKPGPHVLLKISDTGDGIPSEVADRIFDPFFTTKGSEKGTGLGLSTTLGIVKGHKGTIQFTSEPGKGTQFMIYLPAIKTSG